MTEIHKLKTRFENAKRVIMLSMTDPEQSNPVYVEQALERMSHSFDSLFLALLHSLEQLEQAQLNQPPTRPREYMCVQAINCRQGDMESDWRVASINGKPVEQLCDSLTIKAFTRQMLEEGWKSTNAAEAKAATEAYASKDPSAYNLYFYREQASLDNLVNLSALDAKQQRPFSSLNAN